MSAHTADTIQGLADLTAFQATGRRRDEFLQAADRYRERRLSMQRDLSRQNANFELAAGLGGLAVAVTGGLQVAAGTLSAGMLPLLVLIALATFLPVSEISQVSRQLADTIAATRRLHVVSHEPVPVNDGPADAPVSTQACRWPSSTSASPIPASATTRSGPEFHRARRRHGGRGGRVRRGQEHRGQPAAALLGSAIGRGPAGRRRPARPEAGQPARAGRAGHQDTYLFNDTLEGNILLARPEASREELQRALEQAALADFVRHCPTACAPASANAACSCRAASASASRSRGRS